MNGVSDSFNSQMFFERAVLPEYFLLLNDSMVAVVGFKIVLRHSNVDFVGLAAGGYCGSVHKARS